MDSWLAIFVCMATSAVHLEVVSDYSSGAFIATFRRFISRRGICRKTVIAERISRVRISSSRSFFHRELRTLELLLFFCLGKVISGLLAENGSGSKIYKVSPDALYWGCYAHV